MADVQSSATATADSAGANASKRGEASTDLVNYRKDPFYVHPSDNPGLQLVSNPLNLSNYLIWNRSMQIALKAKNKIGFIDGTCAKPEDDSSEAYAQWTFVDSMVILWLLNAMAKDLSEAYMYAASARDLWLELEEKFGDGDKSRVFYLRKQLAALEQGMDSIAAYSNKMKKILEELNCLDPKANCVCSGCTCGAYKKLDESHSSCVVMQFLMGLNDSYDNVVSNVLMLDPLPSFKKVYSMVARIENQKNISSTSTSVIEASAMAAKVFEQQKNFGNNKNFSKKKDKSDRFCTFCNKTGHLEESCFKKIGYPDWFKELKAQKEKKGFAHANAVNAEIDTEEVKQKNYDADKSYISELIQQEFRKFAKNKGVMEDSPVSAGYLADFAGMISCSVSTSSRYRGRWILDSGASAHICGDISLLTNISD